MDMHRLAVIIGLSLLACSHPQPRPAVAPASPEIAPVEEVDGGIAIDAGCVTECLARYPDYADADRSFAAYCEASCTPTEEVNETCVDHCVRAQSGPYYEPDGEGDVVEVEREDQPDPEALAASCQDECRGIPSLEIGGCVDACMSNGGGDMDCSVRCDPDPYDECIYTPCD
jgi:hypothetical protein